MLHVHAFGFETPVYLSIGTLCFLGLLVLVPSIFWLIELIDALRRQFSEPSLKIVWVLVILFTHFLGAIIYYFVGRKQGTLEA